MSDIAAGKRTIVVTGAAQGIGAGIAALLAQEGASIVAIDQNGPAVEKMAGALRAEGYSALPYAIDITDAARVAAIIAEVADRAGGIDGLVNAAGILALESVLTQSLADFERVLHVNVGGTFVMSQAVANVMVKQRRGAIVTIASVAGHTPRMRQAAYGTSKAAVAQLMRIFGLELAAHGIRVNTVSPGPTDTEMLRELIGAGGNADRILAGAADEFRVGIPLRRLAEVRDIAETVAFLLSPKATHITMQDIMVDGGQALGV